MTLNCGSDSENSEMMRRDTPGHLNDSELWFRPIEQCFCYMLTLILWDVGLMLLSNPLLVIPPPHPTVNRDEVLLETSRSS
jgi:hypothetical protein